MKVGLIHATTAAVPPIVQAFNEVAPNIKLLHFMDTSLVPMIREQGSLTPPVMQRFSRLVNMAAESGVDVIQLTCSAFNNITKILQPLHTAKLFRSDEAMLDEALNYSRIGLISTFAETPAALKSYLTEKNPNVHIESMVNSDAFQFIYQGKKEEHDNAIQEMVYELGPKVDVIVLSQYSLEHVAEKVYVSIPVLTGPKLSAKRCLEYMQSNLPEE